MKDLLGGIPPEVQAEVDRLNQKIAELEEQVRDCDRRARELMEREAAGQGVFAAEVFQNKQRKMMLTTEIQHLKVRINHMLLTGELPPKE